MWSVHISLIYYSFDGHVIFFEYLRFWICLAEFFLLKVHLDRSFIHEYTVLTRNLIHRSLLVKKTHRAMSICQNAPLEYQRGALRLYEAFGTKGLYNPIATELMVLKHYNHSHNTKLQANMYSNYYMNIMAVRSNIRIVIGIDCCECA